MLLPMLGEFSTMYPFLSLASSLYLYPFLFQTSLLLLARQDNGIESREEVWVKLAITVSPYHCNRGGGVVFFLVLDADKRLQHGGA